MYWAYIWLRFIYCRSFNGCRCNIDSENMCNLRDDFVRYCAIIPPSVEGLEHSYQQEAEENRVNEHNISCQYALAVTKLMRMTVR